MTLLTLKNIRKSYGDQEVLKGIDLTIKEGEFHTFLGPSGCGKTTLLRIIAGFIESDDGHIIFDGKDISHQEAEKRNVGMVFQNYALFPFMNVYDNIAYGLKVKKMKKAEIKKRVKDYLEIVHLEGYEKRKVSDLSGGEQQRVALARTLVTSPKLLLLDEPLSNLDARLRDKMRHELKAIQSKLGITTIFVTHDQREALSMSDTIAVFNKGTCVQVGTPQEIYNDPTTTFVANFIGDTNHYPAVIKDKTATIGHKIRLNIGDDKEGQDISIRPQDIKIFKDDPKRTNVLKAKIKACKTSGHIIEYVLEGHQTTFKVVTINTTYEGVDYQQGEEVFLWLPEGAIKILRRV